MAISVVVLPQPLGPSRVTSCLSGTVKLIRSRTRAGPKLLVSWWTEISGMAAGFLAQGPSQAEGQNEGDEEDLDQGEGGDRSGQSLGPGLEHRGAEQLGA